MPNAILNDVKLEVLPKDFRMLVRNTLMRLGCQIQDMGRGGYPQIVARDKELFPGNNRWEIGYDIVITWQETTNSVSFSIKVTDRHNFWSQQFCQRRALEIQEALIADAARPRIENENSGLYGTARFATEEDLRKAGYIDDAIDPDRLLLAPFGDDDVISVPKEHTCWHALICGPTGTGKSTGFFVPNLIGRAHTSAIVTEATAGIDPPQLYMQTAGWRAYQGSKIYLFNPSDMTSTRINPIDAVLRAPAHERISQSDALTSLLIANTTSPESQRGDSFWEKSEGQLLTTLIMHLVMADPGQAHFGEVRRLLAYPEETLAKIISDSPSAQARREFTVFKENSDNTRRTILSSLRTRLNPWTNEGLVRLTNKTDIDPNELATQLFTFYVSVPSRKLHMKPIAALAFNYLLDLLLDTKLDQSVMLLLDEFTNFGYIPGIYDAVSIARRRNFSFMLGIQDYAQLEVVYKREKSKAMVAQLATRIFLQPRDATTARQICDGLGQQTLHDVRLSDTGQIQERELGRPLLSVNELMTLGRKRALILTADTPPLLTDCFTFDNFVAPNIEPPPRQPHPIESRYLDADAQAVEKEQETKPPEEHNGEELEQVIHTKPKPKIEQDDEGDQEQWLFIP